MRFENTGDWVVSPDGENFIGGFDTREDAIKECVKSEFMCSYIGEKYSVRFDKFSMPDVTDNINQELHEQLYDAVGDYADDWQLTNEQQMNLHNQLSEVIFNFIEQNHLQPKSFTVKNIERRNYETVK